MQNFGLKLFATLAFLVFCVHAITYVEIEKNVYFQVFNNNTRTTWNSTFNESLESQGCTNTTPISFIIHGWTEGLHKSLWIPYVIRNTLKLHGGCVVVFDYSIYAAGDYGVLCSYYDFILQVLVKKLHQIGNPSRFDFFGFSFGSRLSMGAGANLTLNGVPLVPRMQLCEPAGPGFLGTTKLINPKNASKETVCINTSTNFGTYVYDCNINYLMGRCGISQDGQTVFPKGSHGLCPYFYNASFTNDFLQNYNFNCNPATKINPPGLLLGPRNQVIASGQVCILTAKCYPYVAHNNVTDNFPTGHVQCPADIHLPVSDIFK